MTAFPPITGGGHKVLALQACLAVIETGIADILCPVEDDTFRAADVLPGWPDPSVRDRPQIPLVMGQFTGWRKHEDGGRAHTLELSIGVHCRTVADHLHADVISERIECAFAEQPWIDEGRYRVLADEFTGEELVKLMEVWPGYWVGLSVPVILPAYQITRDEHGQPIVWEQSYGEEGGGVGTAHAWPPES